MKSSDLKVVAIILSIALFFTIITSNAVSIASVVILAKGGSGATVQQDGTVTTPDGTTSTTPGGSTSTTPQGGTTSTTPGGTTSTTPGGSTSTTPGASTSTTPDGSTQATPGGSTSATPGGSTQATPDANKPAGDNQATDKNAWSKEQVFDFYKKSAHEMATTGKAGYNKIEFQELPVLDMGAAGTVLKPIIDGFMTKEADAEVQVQAKGSDDAKNRFPDCTLTDLSKVASATKKDLPNGNYEITIIMMDEDTPMNEESSFLAQVTSSILFWEGIQETIDGLSVIKAVNSRSVLYNDYKIVAEMTKDGKFVSLGHFATVDINANAKISLIGDVALSGQLLNTCKYYDFQY